MHPPQPQLYQVLLDAGIKDIDHLKFLACDPPRVDMFLNKLLENSKVNDFEYTYLNAAMKSLM